MRPALTPKILFEDTHLVVLSKPAGLLSQGEESGDENLVDWLRGHFGRHYVGLVHRLDRNTSGVMVVAKRTKSANRLTEALQGGALERDYRAVLVGTLQAPARWSHSLEKDERTNVVRVVPAGRGKPAALQVSPIARGELSGVPITLAEFRLETGRSHQIRAQSAAEGLPLLGDRKYGETRGLYSRPALHSFRISFPHPMSGERLTFEDAMPADWDQLLRSTKPLR